MATPWSKCVRGSATGIETTEAGVDVGADPEFDRYGCRCCWGSVYRTRKKQRSNCAGGMTDVGLGAKVKQQQQQQRIGVDLLKREFVMFSMDAG